MTAAIPNTQTQTPLFLLSNISNYVTVKLDHTNYLMWKFQITGILDAYSLLDHLEEPTPCPSQFILGHHDHDLEVPEVNPHYLQWKTRDKTLFSLISSTLSPSAISLVMGQTTASGIWRVILNRYTSISRSSIVNLKRELHSIKKNSDSVTQYLQKIKEARDKLVSVGVFIDDEEILHIVLQGLPSDFHSFTSAMLTKNEAVRFEELHTLMKTEEDLLKSAMDNSKEIAHMAMVANKNSQPSFSPFNGNRGRGRNQNSSNRGRGNGRFQSYNTRGGSPGNFNNGDVFSNFGQNPQNSQSWNPSPNSRPTCQICHKLGHTAIDCYQRMNYAYQGRHPPAKLAAMATAAPPDSTPTAWISDTGATDHFTPNLHNIPDNHAYTDSQLVSVGNGNQLPISHIGNSQLRTSAYLFNLRKVLHVPSMKSNLLSVQRFCRDNHCSFSFNADNFQIQDRLTRKPLYKGFSKEGLYPINGLSLPSLQSRLSPAFNHSSTAVLPSFFAPHASYTACRPSVCSKAIDAGLWHMRLGHPQSRVLSHVFSHHFNHQLPLSNTFCKHCVMGKMTQLPFSTSTSCTQFPLQLVHSDVWGPAPINSINGHRYYVIFVDDFTRFTWFFPLKHKSQVLASFQHFKNTMENHLGTSIKTLRTDCGGEYTNKEFCQFCSQSDIIHQFTCPHTSQQNGVAERKHRHIVDMALTLISHSSLPFQYWTYAFSTAIFLIHRLPSLSRGSISPWETLFGKSPNFSLFKSFGCACFPLLRPYSKHKFSLRSKECIFLGYASNSKGYLCLDPLTSRTYISRNVVFNESHYPFSTNTLSCPPLSSSSNSNS
jgi:transposase InsO family protein